ncbi:response regulator transcription factor [Pedobacter sp. JY14-1]|uniref:helix-turn-helix transcriptional regulator n=1 Tax=Pedobacter sp. JY14-1 TaxID=3034151 RepID=UPI0023E14894|nr:response regulator transcription factor [Pedobacter sp. JY14-1]
MKSNLNLQLNSGAPDTLIPSVSVSHFLAHIEMFEFSTARETNLSFSVREPSYLMLGTLYNNTCQLIYLPTGNHPRRIPRGDHHLVLITYRPEWFIHKSGAMTELKDFIDLIREKPGKVHRLPGCRIAQHILRSLERLHTDTAQITFIDHSINRYQKHLKTKKDTYIYYQRKTKDLALFISENYASEMVENIPKLAERFMISERQLSRLAKMAFGVPLHTQVIKIRMNFGLNQLFTTDKPVGEIAGQVGYREPYYFNKAFKKYFGVSPRFLAKT